MFILSEKVYFLNQHHKCSWALTAGVFVLYVSLCFCAGRCWQRIRSQTWRMKVKRRRRSSHPDRTPPKCSRRLWRWRRWRGWKEPSPNWRKATNPLKAQQRYDTSTYWHMLLHWSTAGGSEEQRNYSPAKQILMSGSVDRKSPAKFNL